MKKALEIAKWEFLEKVKSKAFLIYMLVFPIVLILIGVLPSLLEGTGEDTTRQIGLLDISGGHYFANVAKEFDRYKIKNGAPCYLLVNMNNTGLKTEELKKKESDKAVFSGNIDGYLFIKDCPGDSIAIEYRSKATGNFKDLGRFEKALNETRTAMRLKSAGLDPFKVRALTKSVDLKTIKISEKSKDKNASFETMFFSSYIFVMLLMMMILFSGGLLIRSVVEEKSNRIIEIILSSCRADDLMAGKIMGLSALGIFQLTVWLLVAVGIFGSGFMALPPDVFNNFGFLLLYFVLGYVFYTAIFVGVGSIVSTEQEAQQMTSYISIILVMPIILAVQIIQNPNTMLVKVLSYIPLTSPPIMMMRLNILAPPLWEIVLTTAIMIISTWIVIKVTAKIFRIGILSYGKKPGIKQLLSWLKEK
jgi:ABC-2 type transport system permease protein